MKKFRNGQTKVKIFKRKNGGNTKPARKRYCVEKLSPITMDSTIKCTFGATPCLAKH